MVWLGDEGAVAGPNTADRADHLVEFRLELGLPVWRYELDGVAIEKRLLMPHGQNTVHVTYRLLEGTGRCGWRCDPRSISAATKRRWTRRSRTPTR